MARSCYRLLSPKHHINCKNLLLSRAGFFLGIREGKHESIKAKQPALCRDRLFGSGSLESFRRIVPPYLQDTGLVKNVVKGTKKAGLARPAFFVFTVSISSTQA
jgi:hypothetical protein